MTDTDEELNPEAYAGEDVPDPWDKEGEQEDGSMDSDSSSGEPEN